MNYVQPRLDLNIDTHSVLCDFDGVGFHHFMYVIDDLIFSRGEQSTELVFIEEARKRDLKTLGQDQLGDLINNEVKKSMIMVGLDKFKPSLAKQINIQIGMADFSLRNQNKKFASGRMEGIRMKTMIYSNRESKNDIDID